jgi:hypothetical protein
MEIMDMKKELAEKTIVLLPLTIVTGLFYYVIWFLERYKTFNKIAKEEIISRNYIIGMAVLLGLHYLAIIMTDYGGPFVLFFLVVVIASSFRIATALEQHYKSKLNQELKFNRTLLVIFNIFYINYFFNGLAIVEPMQTDRLVQQTEAPFYR